MNEDSNIRISKRARGLLRKIAKKEGRTLKVMFDLAVQYYYEENHQENI